MKTKIFFSLVFLTVVVAITACNKKKEESPQPTSTPLGYASLSAEPATIVTGGTTKITAVATGEGLTYNWSVNSGDIIGSGSQITYAPCCPGQYPVSCIVKDAGGSQVSKSVTVTVQ